MAKTCEVDGHDVGSGTTNFFVYTDHPLAAHSQFRKYLGTNKVEKNLRVSYRDVNGDAFINLCPSAILAPLTIPIHPASTLLACFETIYSKTKPARRFQI